MNLVRSYRTATALGVSALLLGAGGCFTTNRAEGAQVQPCLHGDNETPTELQRRRNAVAFIRAVNTAQARAHAGLGVYQPLSALPNLPSVPDGFTAALAANDDVYAAAVKDTSDPCGYALFSDQTGLIYSGRPLQ